MHCYGNCHRNTPFVSLSTPRLALVALSMEDAPAVFACASDAETCELVGWACHETLQASRQFIARALVGYEAGGHYEWGLKRHGDGALIGSCGFGEIDFERSAANIHYALARQYWGQGYATEAAAAMMQFGFLKIGLRVIESDAFPENTRSLRLMAKLGMRYRETRQMSTDSGVSRPVCVWQVERQQWLERNRPIAHSAARAQYGTAG